MNCVGLRTISAIDMSLLRLKIERGLYAFSDAFRQVTGIRGRRSSIDGLISSKKIPNVHELHLSVGHTDTHTHTQKEKKHFKRYVKLLGG